MRKGGRVVCAGIHMSDIPSFPYRELWEERQLLSVANLTRQDGIDFLRLVPQMGITPYALSSRCGLANRRLHWEAGSISLARSASKRVIYVTQHKGHGALLNWRD